MQENLRHRHLNRFSIVDLAIDILLLATTFAFPFEMPANFLLLTNADFISASIHIGLLIVGYFGLALYVARMYYATAVKVDNKWNHRVLFPTVPLVIFTCLIAFNILFSTYIFFYMTTIPVFAGLLLIGESTTFGFAFGLDFSIERHRSFDARNTVTPDNVFSLSLSSLPYLLVTVLLIFPVDYFSEVFHIRTTIRVVTIIGVCIAAYFMAGKLDETIFSKLKMGASMKLATVAIVAILMVVGFVGFDMLEVFARSHLTELGRSGFAVIAFLFFWNCASSSWKHPFQQNQAIQPDSWFNCGSRLPLG